MTRLERGWDLNENNESVTSILGFVGDFDDGIFRRF